MQSIQIESGSMYNTTSKRLNYKQLDPIDAQAPKKDGAEEASPLNSTRVKASTRNCRFRKPEMLERLSSGRRGAAGAGAVGLPLPLQGAGGPMLQIRR